MTGDEGASRFDSLLQKFENTSLSDSLAFKVIRTYPGLAFVKEYLRDPERFVMLEISDEYCRRICAGDRNVYVGKTDFEAGFSDGRKLWRYEVAESYFQNDLRTLRGIKGPVSEQWDAEVVHQQDVWNGKKFTTVADGRTLLWGFD